MQVTGPVRFRPEGTVNPLLPTGAVEVAAETVRVLARSKTPPFDVSLDDPVDELLRLEYRYLDLRRRRMQENIRLRHRVVQYIREFLDKEGFIEIETPILTKSTPEGARDYLVPSRLHPGQFYALPQSPQQVKQLLMVSGFDRYFQIARCFRDEDPRADRLVEFTQLDLEMAFAEVEDVLDVIERLYASMIPAVAPWRRAPKAFPRLTYRQSMEEYGSDKPDLRFDLRLCDCTEEVRGTAFRVFGRAIAEGGVVKGFAAPRLGGASRRELSALTDLVSQEVGGLFTIALRDSAGPADTLAQEDVRMSAGGLALEEVRGLVRRTGARPGDLIVLAAGPRDAVEPALGRLRLHIGHQLGLADPNDLAFAFVVDFPLFEWGQERGRWTASHHVFTAPHDDHWDILESNPAAVLSKAYDLVANGSELASGSIRLHDAARQRRIFRFLGYTDAEIEERFGHLLTAFEYGAPPHGGIAPGIDRLIMLLSDHVESIRDVIAFPKTQAGVDPLFGAPAAVTQEQLDEMHLSVAPAARKET